MEMTKEWSKENPIPELNLKWYEEKYSYSDGNVEDEIIEIIKANQEVDYSKSIYENLSWPSYYHLTYLRENILNWYPFTKNDSVLEIGCGMGAITNMLCERCGHVTAVELSKRRATAVKYRCYDKDNLEIIVANLNDIEFEQKFDYITLIGVLEYQGTYTLSENPFVDFLKKIKELLKPDGKLLIAIENKYGLKYWCGAKEDHTGIPFDGMNQYKVGNGNARTFSKKELRDLLEKSGYGYSYFYYPLPDYKLPERIYSENYLPRENELNSLRRYYIPDNESVIADERNIYNDLIENEVFEFFANSFLVECSAKENNEGRVVFMKDGGERNAAHRIITTIDDKKQVVKRAKTIYGEEHIKQVYANMENLKNRGIQVLPVTYNNGKLEMEFYDGETLEHRLVSCFEKNETEEAFALIDTLIDFIKMTSDCVPSKENCMIYYGLIKEEEAYKYSCILKDGYIDMIAQNCFVGEKWVFFDQEWHMENVPLDFILYRMFNMLYYNNPDIQQHCSLYDLAEHYNMVESWDLYGDLNSVFEAQVLDRYHLNSSNGISSINLNTCIQNIGKLFLTIPNNTNTQEINVDELKKEISILLSEKKYEQLEELMNSEEIADIKEKDIEKLRNIMCIYSMEKKSGAYNFISTCDSLDKCLDHYNTVKYLISDIISNGEKSRIEDFIRYVKLYQVSYIALIVIASCEWGEGEMEAVLGYIGEIYLEKNMDEDAANIFGYLLDCNPDNDDAKYKLGYIYYKHNNFEKAMEYLEAISYPTMEVEELKNNIMRFGIN